MPAIEDDDTADNLTQWDAAPAQRFLTSVLSFIFYARGSFPEHCFRVVSDHQWSKPETTHQALLCSGSPLSLPKDFVLSQRGPYIYPRRCGDHRLDRFLDGLVGRIFEAVEQKRLGKIQICYSKSRSGDPDALVEFYTLKFRYTDTGSMYIYTSWGGTPNTSISSTCDVPFKELLRTRPRIGGTYYTQPYLFSIDGRPLDGKQGFGFRDQIRNAISTLQDKDGAGGSRIGTLVFRSMADILDEEKERCLVQKKEQSLRVEEDKLAQQTMGRILESHCETLPLFTSTEPDWIYGKDETQTSSSIQLPARETQQEKNLGRSLPKLGCHLSVIEEVSDELPPTQPLPLSSQHTRDAIQLGTQSRPLESFSFLLTHTLDGEDVVKGLAKCLKGNHEQDLSSSPTDILSRPATQILPASSVESPSCSTSLPMS